MAVLKNINLQSRDYPIQRRIQEVNSHCRWLHQCYDGKCPSLVCKGENYYCIKSDLP